MVGDAQFSSYTSFNLILLISLISFIQKDDPHLNVILPKRNTKGKFVYILNISRKSAGRGNLPNLLQNVLEIHPPI